VTSIRTLISEIVTGLGMLPSDSLSEAMQREVPPDELDGVDLRTWTALREAWPADEWTSEFQFAFEAGRYFLHASDGLRDRPPRLVEWKGPDRPPEQNPLPADLRVDRVFIVSCKSLSKILWNPSPVSLFRSALRTADSSGADWYAEAAPNEYQALYLATIRHLGFMGFPSRPTELNRQQRDCLKSCLAGGWPADLRSEVSEFITAVSERSAEALNNALSSTTLRETFYWRLLRLHSAPYFILGRQPSGLTHLRVLTPWDFRRQFRFVGLDIEADHAGQPQLTWSARFVDTENDRVISTEGHVEIRWSHGKFGGAPESKIYLDTPHIAACGYQAI
jgi:hypothetical protein